MANARQVGTPHFPQLVLGSSVNISIPVSGIVVLSLIISDFQDYFPVIMILFYIT
jgi:hypothetical protein